MSRRIPAEVFPPGEFIRDELEARGWTQTDLAEILGRPLKAVSEILTGKRAITPETATGLGEAFGVDPQFWMNLESAYRLSKVDSKAGEVSRRARLYALAPVRGMIRRHWINDAEDIDGLEREVLKFFGVGSVDEIALLEINAAARTSTSYEDTATTYSDDLRAIVEKYRRTGQKWPATTQEIAHWAHQKGLWEPQKKDIVNQLARDLSRAMREEYYTDPQGRRVWTKHAARFADDVLPDEEREPRKTQKVLWADIRTDSADHIIKALQQRRMQIVGNCKQLKTDVDSFNDNHPSGKKIQLNFDFEADLAEMEQPTEYNPGETDVDERS
jgi:addiction module HigA family antidote